MGIITLSSKMAHTMNNGQRITIRSTYETRYGKVSIVGYRQRSWPSIKDFVASLTRDQTIIYNSCELTDKEMNALQVQDVMRTL